MLKKPILIVTLENGENEFKECVEMINKQVSEDFKHVIVSGLNELNAHLELGKIWNMERGNYRLLVKIDADSILMSENSLEKISELFLTSQITGAQIKMFDYFSNDLISGLNVFSNQVSFSSPKTKLRPDNIDLGNTKILKGSKVEYLEPIAWHCKYPSNKQSFVYGFHRTLKNQKLIMRKVANEWIAHNDDSRKWAIIGSLNASKKKLMRFNYSSDKAARLYEVCSNKEISHTEVLNYARVFSASSHS